MIVQNVYTEYNRAIGNCTASLCWMGINDKSKKVERTGIEPVTSRRFESMRSERSTTELAPHHADKRQFLI